MSTITWTADEQLALEQALASIAANSIGMTAKEKFTRVAEIVGTKTARECAARFMQCRQELLVDGEKSNIKPAKKDKDKGGALSHDDLLERSMREEQHRRQERMKAEVKNNKEKLSQKEQARRAQEELDRQKDEEWEREKERLEQERIKKLDEDYKRFIASKKQAEATKVQRERDRLQAQQRQKQAQLEAHRQAKKNRQESAAASVLANIASSSSKQAAKVSSAPVEEDNDPLYDFNSDDDDQDEVCMLCCEKPAFWATAACGHNSICSECCFTMRLVMNKKTCVECQQTVEDEELVITRDKTMTFEEFGIFGKLATRGGVRFDAEAGAFFEDDNHCEDIKKKNSPTFCPVDGCSWQAPALANYSTGKKKKEKPLTDLEILKKHMFETHRAKFCDLCLDNKKCLLHNQPIFTSLKDYNLHLIGGLAEDKAAGFQGHSLCTFCDIRFYDGEALGKHLKKEHFWCEICQKAGRRDFYFENYESVKMHWQTDHHYCEICDDMTAVFPTEEALKKHHAEKHPGAKPSSSFGIAPSVPLCQPIAQGVWTVSHAREVQNASDLTPQDFPSMGSSASSAQPKASAAKAKSKATAKGYAAAARAEPYNRTHGNSYAGAAQPSASTNQAPKVVIAGKKPAYPPVSKGPALPDFPDFNVSGRGKSQAGKLTSGAKHVPKGWGVVPGAPASSANSQAKAKPKAKKHKGKFQDAFIKK